MLRVYHLAKELQQEPETLIDHLGQMTGEKIFTLSPLATEFVAALRRDFAPLPTPSPEPEKVETPQETSSLPEGSDSASLKEAEPEPSEDSIKKAKKSKITLPLPELRSFEIVSRGTPTPEGREAAVRIDRQRKPVRTKADAGTVGEALDLTVPRRSTAPTRQGTTTKKPGGADQQRRRQAGGRLERRAPLTIASEYMSDTKGSSVLRSYPGAGRRSRRRMPQSRPRTMSRRRKKTVQPAPRPTEATLELPVTIGEMSTAFGVRAAELIGFAMKPPHTLMLRINDFVPEDLIHSMAEQFSIAVELKKQRDLEEELIELEESPEALRGEDLPLRAPVVTFLGHVDHGKTTLLDFIRNTKVAASESGGITQHVSAYRVETSTGPITFVDTPGHAAFTEMRSRGADITDVVVLVVAADDGVMPQTEEAVNHARAAGVPLVVALTKIDLPGVNLDKVKTQLSHLDLQPEEWGGSTQMCPVSAKTGEGVDDLLEMLALEAELLNLRALPDRPAYGIVLESFLDEGRGNTIVAIIAQGTLRKGDLVISGTGFGKVKAIYDDRARRIIEAGPATPAHIVGLNALPAAGDKFYAIDDPAKAKSIVERRQMKQRSEDLAARTLRSHVTLENLKEHLAAAKQHEIKIILKADVQGSIDALRQVIESASNEEIQLRILHAAVGGINESDVILADASDAVIIGFHVVADERARNIARVKGVDVRLYQVIYKIADELRASMEGMLAPEEKEVEIGRMIVRATFKSSAIGTIAGCFVEDGKAERNCKIRISRGGIIRHEGALASLRRFKDDVREVSKGFECGIKIKGYDDVKADDRIVCYQTIQVARTLS